MFRLRINFFSAKTIVAFAFYFFSVSICYSQVSNVSYVDPTIGGVGILLEPTRPVVHIPNSMLRMFPVRKDQLDDQISFFPLTISSHRQQLLFGVMPCTGTITDAGWTKRFVYDQEKATPYYYSVRLEESGDSVAFTTAQRAGFFQFFFANDSMHYLRLNVVNNGEIKITGKRIISGEERFSGMKAFFYAEVNADIAEQRY